METVVYLQAWRLKRGLSQKAVAQGAGLTQAQVSRLENYTHTPALNTLAKLARALGLKVEELLRPPPALVSKLSRQELEEIAQAVVSGKREMRPSFNKLADAAASLISQKLNAYVSPGRLVNRGKRWGGKFRSLKLRRLFPDLVLNQILMGVDKNLT